MRCVFGNPFRPAVIGSGCRTATVLALARSIYTERAFDQMSILGDALQDADCEDADVIDHCRKSGPHDRGCWVIDCLLEHD
ncbi:MAG: hypothetical protein C0467_29335 [Planctomycetaceae bacterium]|nr:hypothetical protein [Planctomycetaceae bacterium]